MGSQESTCGRGDALRGFGRCCANCAGYLKTSAAWAQGNGELGSFRQKTCAAGGESGDGEALEGFWRGGDGFVLVLPVLASF